jgi:tRNA pseudouridine65 synthase
MADPDGSMKEARTRVTHLASSSEPRCGLLLAEPFTGRFHQVRRHVRDLDHPILRDPVHGDGRENRLWKDEYGLKRLGLHCARLALTVDGARLDVVCPLAADLAEVLAKVPWWDEVRPRHPALMCEPIVLRSPNRQ